MFRPNETRGGTYQDDNRAKDKIHKEVSRLREPHRCRLESATVREEEVRIQKHAELGSRDEEVGEQSP